MPRRTKAEAQATKESVLNSALVLFSEKGYARTTFTDIARRIGMTRGAVYWHFDSKQALLVEMIEYVRQRTLKVICWTANVQSIEELRRGFIAHTKILLDDPVIRDFEFFLAFQMEWSEELLTKTHEMMAKFRNDPLAEIKQCFSSPGIAARIRPDADIDSVVITLASFWVGLTKIFLGHSASSGRAVRSGVPLIDTLDLVKAVGAGFDLIIGSVLKTGKVEHE